MNIQRTKTTQVIIVPFDAFSLNTLIPQQRLEPLVRLFGFGNVSINAGDRDQPSITFEHGSFDHDTGSYAINRLEIGERKIVFTLEGPSEVADEFFEQLEDFLLGLEDGDAQLNVALRSEESEIVAELGFSVEDLFSTGYLDFVKNTVQRQVDLDIAKATVRPAAIRFRVDYLLQDQAIQEQAITLATKEFIVEPRKGSLLADRIFYSKAPLDTDAHVRLLEELEATLSHR